MISSLWQILQVRWLRSPFSSRLLFTISASETGSMDTAGDGSPLVFSSSESAGADESRSIEKELLLDSVPAGTSLEENVDCAFAERGRSAEERRAIKRVIDFCILEVYYCPPMRVSLSFLDVLFTPPALRVASAMCTLLDAVLIIGTFATDGIFLLLIRLISCTMFVALAFKSECFLSSSL